MANLFAPFGFHHVNARSGATPSYENETRKIALGNTTPINYGDPVVMLSTGYITRATPGTTQIAGIFLGATYNSISLSGRLMPMRNWPGNSDAIGDADALIIANGDQVLKVQANGLVTRGNIGNNANFAIGTPSALLGTSGAYLDVATIGTTATLPFRIIDLVTDPPGENGTDITSINNMVLVRFNNVDARSLIGI